MHYAQLNEDGTYLRDLPDGNIEFGPKHFQPAGTLSQEERAWFNVVPLFATERPVYDPITQAVRRDGAEIVNSKWVQRWAVDALDAATVAANQAAKAERLRLEEIDAALKTDAILSMLDGMTKAQYDTWWSNRTAAQKDKMLQLLVLAHARSR